MRGAPSPLSSALAGCPGSSLTTCGAEPDLTGHWTLHARAFDGDAGGRTCPARRHRRSRPRADEASEQHPLGALIWGTLTSTDKGFFDTLTIPQLVMNNGSKTGGVVGCTVKINVPVATMVTDDDADNGPLRIALPGRLSRPG